MHLLNAGGMAPPGPFACGWYVCTKQIHEYLPKVGFELLLDQG